ncbi:MAG: DUF2189 domain-containing protein [bacterium]
MNHEIAFRDIQLTSSEIEIRKISVKDLLQSLREGYDDFTANPSFGVFLVIIYPLFAVILTVSQVGENLLYLAFPMVAGLTLIGPVVSVCLFEMSKRREQELEVSWGSSFEFVHSRSYAPILALSFLMMLLYSAWVFMAQFIYLGLFGAMNFASFTEFVTEVVTTKPGGALIVYGNAVGFIFAFAALSISVVGFPLLLDKPTSSATAVAVSFRAVNSNTLVMLLWGLIVVALLTAGAMLFMVGLAVVLPVLGHATWHLYRKVVKE